MKNIKLSDGSNRLVFDLKKDSCPICKTPFNNGTYFSWRMFHGEASSSCCGAIYQMKGWYADPKKNKQDIIDFSDSLDNKNLIWLKIGEDWIKPLQKAISKINIQNIHNENVYEMAKKLKLGKV